MSSAPARSASARTPQLTASLLEDGLDVRLRLAGWSMKPLIRTGTLVRFTSRGTISRGDVVLVRHANDKLVAHRVVALGPDFISTKGDACRTPDAPVPRSSVIGRAVSMEGKFPLPPLRVSSAAMRLVGLAIGRIYPAIVLMYGWLSGSRLREGTASC